MEKYLITGTTEGSRRRGRPARAWISDIMDWSEMTVEMILRAMSDRTTRRTRNLADADKPRDAFRGQSRSPNTVPFDMLGMVSY